MNLMNQDELGQLGDANCHLLTLGYRYPIKVEFVYRHGLNVHCNSQLSI